MKKDDKRTQDSGCIPYTPFQYQDSIHHHPITFFVNDSHVVKGCASLIEKYDG